MSKPGFECPKPETWVCQTRLIPKTQNPGLHTVIVRVNYVHWIYYIALTTEPWHKSLVL